MAVNRYQFEILKFLEKSGKQIYKLRTLSDTLKISGSQIEKCIEELKNNNFISFDENYFEITDAGIEALEPYRVKRAIIMAAGFGERMLPATKERPKPLVKLNGVRILDTLLDALVAVGIEDIYVIRGYRKEVFDELKEKYPFVTLIDNDEYDKTNNISSVMKVIDKLDSCYLCESDLYISNQNVITKYQYASNILGSYSMETDDWSYKMVDGYLSDYKKGNTFCYNYYGISYWTKEDCEKLRRDFTDVYNNYDDGKNYFWEFVPFVLLKDRYKVEIRECQKSDIIEIDSYHELQQLDPSYK